jgi:hypothetical protein
MKYLSIIALVGFLSCSKEEFTSSPKSDSFTANPVEVFQNLTCSNSTLIKPPVDILYLVDNSLSASYLASSVKDQIRRTILSVSGEFDFHIMIAPLLPTATSERLDFFPVVTNSAQGMPSSVNVIPLESLDLASFFPVMGGVNYENGFDRAVQILQANRSNSVFRSRAHTIVVLVSNGDDTTTKTNCFNGLCTIDSNLFQQKYRAFSDLKNSLNALQLRFFSVVAHTQCQSGWAAGTTYKNMSAKIYSELNTTPALTDQSTRSTPDSYDLCNSQYTSMYEGVNNSIKKQVVGHVYNRWLINSSTAPTIDLSDIQVFKLNSSGVSTAVAKSSTQGFSCCQSGTYPTRELPTLGEEATGTFIQLHGSGKVTYPDCLIVKTRTPTEFFNAVVISAQPLLDSINVRIRGQTISQNTTNGWSYEGYKENENIKVNSDGSPNTTTPLRKTGYFIKLNGSAIYSSGDTIEIFFKGAPL